MRLRAARLRAMGLQVMKGQLVKFLRFCLLIVLGAATATIPPITPARAEDRALVIGIDRYPHLLPKNQLTAAVNDARAMAALARDVWGFKPHQIKLLINEAATAGNILNAIETWLIAGTRPGDRVLLTYSGHGYYQPDLDGDEPDGQDETLAPYDVRYRQGTGFINMVSDDDINRLLARLEGRDVMMVIDSCHSGTITRALTPASHKGPTITRALSHAPLTRSLSDHEYAALRSQSSFIEARPNLMAWSAVAPIEKAHEDMSRPPAARNGVFTRSFIEGLRGRRADSNGNGVITAAELLTYTRAQAGSYCRNHGCETGMTPVVELPQTDAWGRDLLAWGRRTDANGAGQQPQITDIIAPGNGLQDNGDNGGVHLEILPRARVRLGEAIRLRVRSVKPGWLILLDVRDNGEVRQLFPSICARPSRKLRAGAPLTLPDATYGCEFTASEAGKGKLLAIVTQDNVSLDDLLAKHRDIAVVADSKAYLSEIAAKLMAVWTADPHNRPVHWSLAVAEYEVK